MLVCEIGQDFLYRANEVENHQFHSIQHLLPGSSELITGLIDD